jgi:hypothetical protein
MSHYTITFSEPAGWTDTVSALAAVVALVIAVGTAWWKAHLHSKQLKHDLFDKLLKVYRPCPHRKRP